MMIHDLTQWVLLAFFAVGALGGWVIAIVFAVEVVKGWKNRKRSTR